MLSQLKKLIRKALAARSLELRKTMPAVTLEPLKLALALYSARGKGITILQAGAGDGISHDPIYRYLERISSRAILVEPNPLAFERLKKAYAGQAKVTLVQAAIGERDGEAHLYRVKSTGQPDVEEVLITSFYREHLEHYGIGPERIERITVPCRTLSSLLAEQGLDTVDLLQIDVEGYDAAIVRMALDMRVLPGCIGFEHFHLTRPDRMPLFDLLQSRGYLVCYDDWNILALSGPLLEQFLQDPFPAAARA